MCRGDWGRAGGVRRAGYGRAVAGEGQALVRGAAQQPAEPGAQAADAVQGECVEGGVRVVGGIGVCGEQPVLAQEVQHAARGLGHGEGGQQGEQEELEGGRNPGVQDRPGQGARGVGFARCGGLVCH